MAGNVDVLRGAYQAFGRGDMQAVTETWEADIEFVGPNSTRMPGAGTHRGKEAVELLFSGMRERWEGLALSPDEFVEQGDTVVVLGHLESGRKPDRASPTRQTLPGTPLGATTPAEVLEWPRAAASS
jgi:ketosteroid isomerase-like protein